MCPSISGCAPDISNIICSFCLLSCNSRPPSNSSIFQSGQFSLSFNNHSGPIYQILLSFSSSIDIPLVGKSAGLLISQLCIDIMENNIIFIFNF